ncbi:MAG: putative bicarbonate transporter, IctB family [Synechococcales cyanobacterium RM1_1_8]|nr:putative bicarbonate transporter, IctB family [Synechococcales cyanobacterium RM1_1_8]
MDSFWQSAWQTLTLGRISIAQWQRGSWLHRFTVGLLQPWRNSSLLHHYGEALGTLLISIILGLAPFVDNTLTAVLLVACAGLWLLLTLSDKPGRGLTPIHLVVALYAGIMLLATGLSPVKTAAAAGLVKALLYMFLFLLAARVLRNGRLRNWVILVYLFVSQVVSIYGIRQHFFGADALATWVDPSSNQVGTTRVYSFLGNPNLLGAYLLPGAMLSIAAFFVWRSRGPKALAALMFLTNSACLVLTYSRGAWIGLLLSLAAMALLLLTWLSARFTPFWQRWALPAVLGAGTVVVLAAVVLLEPLRNRVVSLFAGREDSSNNFRLNVWAAVVEMIKDRPVLGIGPGNQAFNSIYPLYQQPRFTALSAYSIFLETLVETGFIGFTAFLWMLLVIVGQGWRSLKTLRHSANPQAFWLMAAIATLPGELGQGLFDTVWYRPEVQTLWWLCIGLIASFYSPLNQALAGDDAPAQPEQMTSALPQRSA